MKRHSAYSPIVLEELCRLSEQRSPMEHSKVRLMARVLALDYETVDAAINYALQKGWLADKGEPPQSICLTEDGRTTTRRRIRQ